SFFFSSRRRHTRFSRDWSSDVCSSDLGALAADALAVDDVELGLLERRGHLVLDHLDPGAVADHLAGVLEALDAPDVEPHRGVERSEERRVGKECRARWSADECTKRSTR